MKIKYRGIEKQTINATATTLPGAVSSVVNAHPGGLSVKRPGAGDKVEIIFWGEVVRHLPTLLEGSEQARKDVRAMVVAASQVDL